jgi:hypothetical protein
MPTGRSICMCMSTIQTASGWWGGGGESDCHPVCRWRVWSNCMSRGYVKGVQGYRGRMAGRRTHWRGSECQVCACTYVCMYRDQQTVMAKACRAIVNGWMIRGLSPWGASEYLLKQNCMYVMYVKSIEKRLNNFFLVKHWRGKWFGSCTVKRFGLMDVCIYYAYTYTLIYIHIHLYVHVCIRSLSPCLPKVHAYIHANLCSCTAAGKSI